METVVIFNQANILEIYI